ncbi:MAG: hypothetical protein AAF417_21345, partial [Pseudomonadota bacterium]
LRGLRLLLEVLLERIGQQQCVAEPVEVAALFGCVEVKRKQRNEVDFGRLLVALGQARNRNRVARCVELLDQEPLLLGTDALRADLLLDARLTPPCWPARCLIGLPTSSTPSSISPNEAWRSVLTTS